MFVGHPTPAPARAVVTVASSPMAARVDASPSLLRAAEWLPPRAVGTPARLPSVGIAGGGLRQQFLFPSRAIALHDHLT